MVALLPSFSLVLWVIGATLAIVRGMAAHYQVSRFAVNAITIIGTGFAVDISLFFHIRFKEERVKDGSSVQQAVTRMLATSGRAVVFSATTLCICLSGTLLFNEYYLTSMAASIMIVALTAAMGALVLLPLLYLTLADRIFLLSTDPITEILDSFAHRNSNTPISAGSIRKSSGFYFRIASFVMQFPLWFLLSIGGMLSVFFFVFVFKLRMGSWGIFLVPVDSSVRQTFDSLKTNVNYGANSVIEVYMQTVSETQLRSPEFLTALDAYSSELEAIPAVSRVVNILRFNPQYNFSEYIAYINGSLNSSSILVNPFYLTDAKSIVRTSISLSLEKDDPTMPGVIDSIRSLTSSPQITRFLSVFGCTGDPVSDYDVQSDLRSNFPGFISILAFGMYLMILIVTRSILLPIQAIITAFLSLVSAFGILVLALQDGPNLSGTLDPLQLLFIFTISFALSLDYEMFMLSRIHEIWEIKKEHKFAISLGIELSAKTISFAAFSLCIILIEFMTSKIILLVCIGTVYHLLFVNYSPNLYFLGNRHYSDYGRDDYPVLCGARDDVLQW